MRYLITSLDLENLSSLYVRANAGELGYFCDVICYFLRACDLIAAITLL